MPSRKKSQVLDDAPNRRGGDADSPFTSQHVAKGIFVTNGGLRAIVFDPKLRIRRSFEWTGEIQFSPGRGDSIFSEVSGDRIKLWPPRVSPDFGNDIDLFGDGPIELTPLGPRQPGKDDRPSTAEKETPEEEKPSSLGPPIELDLWGHIPPAFPSPFWRPPIDFDANGSRPLDLSDYYGLWNPCDLFHPLGPFGPFAELPDRIELIFPRVPWLGPFQPPLEKAIFEALREFLKEIGKAEEAGTIQGDDWEKAGRKAGQKAAKVLWDFIKDRLKNTQFSGDFNFDSICEFARRRPWLTGAGVVLGVGGYGLYLGDQYRRKGKIKVDFGDFKFEYDSESGDWSVGIRFKFKF